MIVAFDVAFRTTGFATMKDDGSLVATATAKVPARVAMVDGLGIYSDNIRELLRVHFAKDSPGAETPFGQIDFVVEDPWIGPANRAVQVQRACSISLGIVYATIRLWSGRTPRVVPPSTWKSAIGIRGKRFERAKAATRIATSIWPRHHFATQDEVDAALLAEWFRRERQFESRVRP